LWFLLRLILPLNRRSIRSKHGRFKPGIIPSNFDDAQKWAEDLGYSGPFVLAVDDTKTTAGLRSYMDGGIWHLGGMHGEVKSFKTYETLLAEGEIDRSDLADKVGCSQNLSDDYVSSNLCSRCGLG
jgi:hypothetical protein